MIKIICIGKIKEKYLQVAINDYYKRLSKYTKVKIIELDNENYNNSIQTLNKESIKILKRIDEKDYIIALDIKGEELDTITFTNKIKQLYDEGKSNIPFIIGGSDGLANNIKDKANYHLSFSKMTFPHQLFRLLLLEQLYRCYKIINNETYHK